MLIHLVQIVSSLVFLFRFADGAQKAETFAKLIEHAQPVPTLHGIVVGQIWDFSGKQAAIFRGLRYAEPPVGDLRFKKPQSLKNFNEKYEAYRYKPACVQFAPPSPIESKVEAIQSQSEDCLYLNIFAPTKGRKNPVLVWIHGGSFATGSGAMNMEDEVIVHNIVSKGVILVTINYRLGVFGFAVGPPGEDTNFGIWDQVEALKWVHENIGNFGGDPEKVTIMGESAGGAAVSILAMSEKTQGYVSRAIIMSGSIAAYWALTKREESLYNYATIADYLACRDEVTKHPLESYPWAEQCNFVPSDMDLKCDKGVSEDSWSCFQKKAGHFADKKLQRLREKMTIEQLPKLSPVIDGDLIAYNSTKMLETFPRMPIMVGVARDEWGKRPMYIEKVGYKENYDEKERLDYMQLLINEQFPEQQESARRGSVAAHYQYIDSAENGTKHDKFDTVDFARLMKDIERDMQFICPAVKEAQAYAKKKQDVYLYTFDHEPAGGMTLIEQPDRGIMGIDSPVIETELLEPTPFHGLDHAYIFTKGTGPDFKFDYDKDDKKVSEDFVTYITNFVKGGNPNDSKGPKRRPEWPTFTEDNPHHMKIRSPPESQLGYFYWPITSFWNEYMPKLMSEKEEAPRKSRDASRAAYKDDERSQLAAYKQSWLALWILVGIIMAVLWIIIIALVVRRCMTTKTTTHGPVNVYRNL